MENNINAPSFNKFSKNKWKELSKNQEENIFTTYSERELADKFYNGVPDISTKNYNVYSDDEELDIRERKIDAVFLPNYKSSFEEIDVNIYMSKNGLQLLSMYNSLVPIGNSINIFLEKDSTLNINTIMRVKVSDKVKDISSIPIVKLQYISNFNGVRITSEILKELIEKEALANRESFFAWLLQIKDSTYRNICEFFQDGILNGLGDFFEEDIAKNIEKLKLEEVDWNPAVENYKPFLLPSIFWDNQKLNDNSSLVPKQNREENILKNVLDSFFEYVNGKKTEFIKITSKIESKLPESLSKISHRISNEFLKGFDSLQEHIQKNASFLQSLAVRKIRCVNALLCGIYNSLIDVVAGFFSIISLLFKGLAILQNVHKDPSIVTDYVLEFFEQFVEAIVNFDINEFLFEWISFQLTTAYKIYLWVTAEAPNVSLEKVFYYAGYIIGLIIDIIIETLLTGGTSEVIKLIDTTLDFMRHPLKKMQEAIFAGIDVASGILVSLVDFVTVFFSKLKKGVKTIFDELKIWIEEIFNIGKKVRNFIMESYEDFFSPKVREFFEKIGLRPTKYENGVFNMCPIN